MSAELLLYSDENVASWKSLNLSSSVFCLSVKHFDNNQDTLEKLPRDPWALVWICPQRMISEAFDEPIRFFSPTCIFMPVIGWTLAILDGGLYFYNRLGSVKFHEPPTWQKQNTFDINGTLKITRTVAPNNKALRYFMTLSNIGLMNLVASWVS